MRANLFPVETAIGPIHLKAAHVRPLPQCFVAGTQIDTPSGPRCIEELRVGDSVYSVDLTTGKRVVDEIWTLSGAENVTPLRVEFSDGSEIDVTADHPFHLARENRYQKIGEMPIGSSITTFRKGRLETLELKRRIPLSEPMRVYNFGVKRNQNYLIKGILVHNHPKQIT